MPTVENFARHKRPDFGCLSLCFETHDGIVMDSCGVYGPTLFARWDAHDAVRVLTFNVPAVSITIQNASVRATGSLLLSFAGGDTAHLVFGIFHTVSSIYVYQLTSARTSLSRFPAAVSLRLTVPNDDSGILTVTPLVLFGSEAESDAAWAAVQHGISAALAL